MAMNSFLIVLLIFILSGVIVLRPIIDQKKGGPTAYSGRYDALLAEKERLYTSIEELDQSLDLKKISAEDHSRLRSDLLNQAAFVLAELDKKGGKKRKPKVTDSYSSVDDELEKMIQTRRETLRSGTLIACPKCGESVESKDQFCSHCGESL